MWWVRVFCLLVPVALVGGLVSLWGEMRKLTIEVPDELVIAVREDPGTLNPLQPSAGFRREITDLVFEKLFRRDDEMLLRSHLAERWEERQTVSFLFGDPDEAKAAAALLDGLREAKDARSVTWGVRGEEVIESGGLLRVELGHHRPGVAAEIDSFFDAEMDARKTPTLIRLTVKDSARDSFELFRRDAVEAGQIRHVVYGPDGRSAWIAVAGEVDLFQRELELFYEANPNLEPRLELVSETTFFVELSGLLHLQAGVSWHDGVPFSANDVVFSFRQAALPESGSPLAHWFEMVRDVEVLDPLVVKVTLEERYAPLAESWELLPILPAHRLASSATGGAKTASDFFTMPVGTGPYRVADREAGKSVTLEAFEDYFRGAPLQKRVEYRVFATRHQRAMGLRLRQIDIVRPDELERVVLRGDERYEEIDGVPRTQSFVAWNLRREPFVDVRVRQALAHLVDIRGLVEDIAGQESQPARGIFYPGLWICPDEVELPEFDPDLGLQLLAEAGWTPAPVGEDTDDRDPAVVLRNGDGDPLRFTLLVGAGQSEHRQMAAELAESWRAAGVDVEVQALPWSDLIASALASREFDAVLLSLELGFHRDHAEMWHSREADSESGGGNLTGLRNQIVDDLLDHLTIEADPETVRTLAEQLQELVWALQPCLFLYESGEVLMARREVLREQRPMMDGRRSDRNVVTPPAGLIVSRPWWVKQREGLAEVVAGPDSPGPVPPARAE